MTDKSPILEAEAVAKKVIRRIMRDKYVCQKVSDEELRQAYRGTAKKDVRGLSEREKRYLEIWGNGEGRPGSTR